MISISYIRLTISQKRLRVRPLFFGMFTKEWVRMQHAHLKRNHLPHDKNQARTGIMQIGLLMIKVPKKLWDLRNHDGHAPPERQVPGYRRLMLLSKVEALYDLEPWVLSLDKTAFFGTSFEKRKTQSNQQLQSYLDFYTRLVHDSVKQAADMGANFLPINHYFALPPPEPNADYDPNANNPDITEIAP